MEEKNEKTVLLELMHRPAFLVQNGIITQVNAAAAAYLLQPGMEVGPLIATGHQEYDDFTEGYLHLFLEIEGCRLGATVGHSETGDIFVLGEDMDSSRLQVLALAAAELRQPLANAMVMTDTIAPMASQTGDPAATCVAQLNRRMMQLQRIIGNMADCANFDVPNHRNMEYVDISTFLKELLEQAAQALLHAGYQLAYSLPDERIYTLANPQKLERAVYNMLSNAAKFSPAGSTLRAKLIRRENRLAFSVTDEGPGIRDTGDIFTRYMRQPGLEDPRFGLGLGMVLIRSTAALHGGAVLIDHPGETGTRVTMTMAISESKRNNVHSPIFRIDYAGERDHCLLELSDVLPAKLYGE